MNNHRIEIEALERRIALLQYRLFELRNEPPDTVPMDLGVREYRTAAYFGFERENDRIALIGACSPPGGNAARYQYMLDRHVIETVSNRDVFSFWEHVLGRTIRHLAHEMYDPEADLGRPEGEAPPC